jgi:hypothetical protein
MENNSGGYYQGSKFLGGNYQIGELATLLEAYLDANSPDGNEYSVTTQGQKLVIETSVPVSLKFPKKEYSDMCGFNSMKTRSAKKLISDKPISTNFKYDHDLCSCLNSDVLSPKCFDPICQQKGYTTVVMDSIKDCGTFCKQVLSLEDVDRANISDVTFQQNCPGGDSSQEKPDTVPGEEIPNELPMPGGEPVSDTDDQSDTIDDTANTIEDREATKEVEEVQRQADKNKFMGFLTMIVMFYLALATLIFVIQKIFRRQKTVIFGLSTGRYWMYNIVLIVIGILVASVIRYFS